MRLKLKTTPAAEPISLGEAKNYLRVDSAEDNALITSLIMTARQLAERETKRAFITQTWQMCLDFAPAEIEVPKPPLQSVESIMTISAVESAVDQDSAMNQAVLYIGSTTGFATGDSIIVDRDGAREEKKAILSIQADVSLTLTTNLVYAHTAMQADRVEKYSLVSKTQYNVDASQNSPGRVKLRSGCGWPTHRNFASFIIEFKAGYGDAAANVPEALRQEILKLLAYLYDNRSAEGIPESMKSRFWPFRILRI